MKFWGKIIGAIKRRKTARGKIESDNEANVRAAAESHLRFLQTRPHASLEHARPFVESFRPKEFGNNFRIELRNAVHESPTGIALLKGRKVIGEARLNFLEEHGKRIASVEAIQGRQNGFDAETFGKKIPKEILEFERLAGKSWAEALVQHALDTAYNSRKFDRFRLVTAKSQSYFSAPSKLTTSGARILGTQGELKKHHDRFRGSYDWTARKIGMRKKVLAGKNEYWVLDLP